MLPEDQIVEPKRVLKATIKNFNGVTIQGAKGDTGEKGEKGDRGEKGSTGAKGKDGKDGRDGIDGLNGVDGRDGVDGKDGKDGLNGKDGSPDTAEQVRDKLSSLEGEERLDAKHIKNLPKNIVGGVSGIKEIIAGTNITVDNSNLGYPVISSTGGGGGGTITVSDTDPTGSATDGDIHLLTDDGTTGGVVIKTFLYDGAWIDTTEPDYEKCKNVTGSTITKGKIVYVNGANGGVPTITLADNTTETTSSKSIGIVAKNITNNSDGYFIRSGLLIGVDTSTFSAGDTLWLGTNGNITNTRPSAPNHAVFVGYALTSASSGRMLVSVMNGYELDELHNVSITTPTNGQVLTYESATGLWKNQTPSGGGGGSLTKGIVEVDFGANTTQSDIATVSVADATVTSTSYPSVSMYAIATTDHDPDDYMVEGLIPYVTNVQNGVGFDISVRAPNFTYGKYKVTYQF